jgi:hypothetical protein
MAGSARNSARSPTGSSAQPGNRRARPGNRRAGPGTRRAGPPHAVPGRQQAGGHQHGADQQRIEQHADHAGDFGDRDGREQGEGAEAAGHDQPGGGDHCPGHAEPARPAGQDRVGRPRRRDPLRPGAQARVVARIAGRRGKPHPFGLKFSERVGSVWPVPGSGALGLWICRFLSIFQPGERPRPPGRGPQAPTAGSRRTVAGRPGNPPAGLTHRPRGRQLRSGVKYAACMLSRIWVSPARIRLFTVPTAMPRIVATSV